MTCKTLISLFFLAMTTAATAQQPPDAQPKAEEAEVEAAATNATLAMKLCLENYRTPDALLQAFRQAGFAHAPEDLGGGAVLHWFTTPTENVRTAVVADAGAVECRIGTGLWGVEAMQTFATDVFGAITQGVEIQAGGPEGQTVLPGSPEAQQGPCSGFHVMLPQSMLWVQIERQGNDGTCISDGTSVMRMRF